MKGADNESDILDDETKEKYHILLTKDEESEVDLEVLKAQKRVAYIIYKLIITSL